MGAGNVAAALRESADKGVGWFARAVLAAMALRSLDHRIGRNEPRYYYAGHEEICLALGLDPLPSQIREVRRAIGVLRDVGLVEDVGRVGRKSCYRLRLEAVDNPGDDRRPSRSP